MLRLLSGIGAQRRALPAAARALCQVEPARRVVVEVRDHMKTRRRLLQRFEYAIKPAKEDEEVPAAVYQLLRQCGSGLQLERPGERVRVAEEIVEQLKRKGLKLDVGIYNSLLLVYLQNEHIFVPSEFVEQLKLAGLSPNTGTIAALLQAYCQQGNLAGATQLLEHMGAQDVPISEYVYSHLIQAHARSGDMASAAGMLQVMRENGLPLSSVPYSALLVAHAERGDMEAMEQLMASMRAEQVFPSLGVFGKLLDTLSRSGHNQHILKVLGMIRNKQWMQADLRDLVCEFAVRGEVASAMMLLRCLADMGACNNTASFTIVKSMLQGGRSCLDVMATAKELVEMGFTQELFEELLGWYYHLMPQAHVDMATVLDEMLEQKMPLKPHYFYPLLAHHCAHIPEVVATVQRMLECGFSCDKFVTSVVMRNCRSTKELIKAFKDADILPQVAGDFMLEFCSRAKFSDALLFMYEAPLPSSADAAAQLMDCINSGVRHRMAAGDVASLVSLYDWLRPAAELARFQHSLQLVVGHLTFRKELDTASSLVAQLEEKGLDMGETAYKKLLVALLVGHFQSDSGNEFMKVLSAMRERGYQLGSSENTLLLRVASQSGDVNLTMSVLEQLESSGAEVPAMDYCSAIITLVQYPKHLPLAYQLYQKVVGLGSKPTYEAFSALAIALVQSGDMTTSEHMLQSMSDFGFHGSARLYNSFMEVYAHRGEVDKLTGMLAEMVSSEVAPTEFSYALVMEGYAQHGAVENILTLIQQVEGRGMAVNRRMISVLMEAYIARGQLGEAMAVMQRYPRLVPKLQVLSKLFRQLCVGGAGGSPSKEEAEEGREQVAALMSKTQASKAVVDDIKFYCYLEGGMVERAREIMLQDGFQLRADNFLRFICKVYDNRQFECSRQSLQLAKEGGYHKTHEPFAVALVDAYRYTGDKAAIAEVEEELRGQASDKFKTYIEKVLKTTKNRYY